MSSEREKSGDQQAKDARFVRWVLMALAAMFLLYAGWKAYHIRTAFKAWESQAEIPIPKDPRLMPAK